DAGYPVGAPRRLEARATPGPLVNDASSGPLRRRSPDGIAHAPGAGRLDPTVRDAPRLARIRGRGPAQRRFAHGRGRALRRAYRIGGAAGSRLDEAQAPPALLSAGCG